MTKENKSVTYNIISLGQINISGDNSKIDTTKVVAESATRASGLVESLNTKRINKTSEAQLRAVKKYQASKAEIKIRMSQEQKICSLISQASIVCLLILMYFINLAYNLRKRGKNK